jgi:hypothetical protein
MIHSAISRPEDVGAYAHVNLDEGGQKKLQKTYAAGIRTHKVDSFSTAMIALRTIAIRSEASQALDPARELIDYPLRSVLRNSIALRICDGAGILVSAKALSSGLAALERSRSGALVGNRLASAIADPATVSGTRTALGFATALDVSRIRWTASIDGGAAGGGAVRFLDTDAWRVN